MIAAVIPVKRLAEAKSRLASRLTAAERSELVMNVLGRCIGALRASPLIDLIALATPEISLAHSFQVEAVPDAGSLNAALTGAVGWARDRGAGQLLMLPGDLAMIRPGDINDMVHAAHGTRSVAIAPTRDGGTGALLLTPPDIIPPSFGPSSFQRHLELARDQEVPVYTVLNLGLSFELDTVDDLDALLQFGDSDTAL